MARAESETTTRRAALRHLAIAAAMVPAVPYTALALADPVDPILALIEAHRAAALNYWNAIDLRDQLEQTVPKRKRQSHFSARGRYENFHDDPRWVENERFIWDHRDEPDRIADEMLQTKPTTLAGVASLLAYVGSADYGVFPDTMIEDDGGDRPFEFNLCRMLGEATAEIARAS